MASVLITGGGGYLGCHLAARLLEAGRPVRIFDRFCFGREAVAELERDPRCEVLSGDIRRLQEHEGLLDGVDAVAHLAGLANDPSCDLNADMAEDINVASAVELARAASQHGVKRFVLASSCSVYGRGVFDILDEESPTYPVSTFAHTKRGAEKAVLRLAQAGFEPVAARMATLYGASPRMRFDLAINQMTATALRHQRIEVRGGGAQWRPFLHVADAAEAIALLLDAPAGKVAGEIFNVGDTAQNYRIGELADRIAATFSGVTVEYAKDDADLRNFHVDCGKLRDAVGFAPRRDIDAGLAEVAGLLQANPGLDPFDERHINVNRVRKLMATPVAEGGEPVAARFIPLSTPHFGPEEEEAVLEAMRSGWLTAGPHNRGFERAFAETVGAKHAVAVNSCTAALHLCLVAHGVGPGDEVIMSPITWASVANTIAHMGARIVFADVQPDTLNLDPAAVEAAITPRTKAIMPVDMAGRPCDLPALRAIADKHGLPLIEDAAHALGAALGDTAIGGFDHCACFSFYAIKNITTIEGGMITAGDAELAEKLRLLATNGMAATAWDRYGRSAAPGPPQVVVPGFKYVMGNLNAAMGLAQLKKFPAFKAARKRIAHLYRTALAEVDEITLPAEHADIEHAWHLFIIQLDESRLDRSRDAIAQDLRRENIGTGVHFYGLHLHQYYREALGLAPEALPNATACSRRILSLPLHPGMTDKNVHEAVTALKKVLRHARK